MYIYSHLGISISLGLFITCNLLVVIYGLGLGWFYGISLEII